jgi:signal recognition particle GTPase
MKKVFALVIIILASSQFAMAQPPGGPGGQRGAQMQEALKQRLKDDVKLTDAKADSVLAIQREIQPKQRAIRMDQNLTDDEKKTKVKELMDMRKKRWAAAGLTTDEVKKVDEMFENMQRMMQQRGGAGAPPKK